eukprot:scaffold650_cov407-Prasinococcus_capsulatus_cf.AAC.46
MATAGVIRCRARAGLNSITVLLGVGGSSHRARPSGTTQCRPRSQSTAAKRARDKGKIRRPDILSVEDHSVAQAAHPRARRPGPEDRPLPRGSCPTEWVRCTRSPRNCHNCTRGGARHDPFVAITQD